MRKWFDEPPSGSGSRHAARPGQEHVEQAGIFRGEYARQPAICGVVDGEPGLDAGEPLVVRDEGLQRQAKLVGLRLILGVEHRDECAADERQRGVERFRLGARAAIGGNQDLEGRPELQAAIASRVTWSSGSRTNLISSFSSG